MRKRGITTPLIGDFHYIGHKLLADYPACAEALDKYRINPGNVGFKNKRDSQFTDIIEIALKNNKPVRIGANWGSLDQELLTRLMEDNAKSAEPLDARAVTREAMVQSALLSAARAEEIGLPKNRIILSAKVSGGAGPDRRLQGTGWRVRITPSISASPKPAWDRRASSPLRPRSAFCCRTASATPSGSR